MWVKCIIRKISDCYLKLPYEQTLIVSHFSRILLTDFIHQIKDKIVNFKKISESVCILPTYVLYIHIYIYIYICIYIYQQARVSSFPGPISMSRVDE